MAGTTVVGQTQYAGQSDAELTQLAAQWEALSTEQRRALLTEVKSRMSAQRSDGKRPVLRIQAQRRFGRTVRQPDGTLVRIETRQQIVRYHRLPDSVDAAHAFGRGFEQRMADSTLPDSPDPETDRLTRTPETPPVMRVTHPYRQ